MFNQYLPSATKLYHSTQMARAHLAHKLFLRHCAQINAKCTSCHTRERQGLHSPVLRCKPTCEKINSSQWKQPVCTQRAPCSILGYFKRKGTTRGAKQYRLKFGWVALTEVNLLNAGRQTIYTSLQKLSATLPRPSSNTLSSLWRLTPLMKLVLEKM